MGVGWENLISMGTHSKPWPLSVSTSFLHLPIMPSLTYTLLLYSHTPNLALTPTALLTEACSPGFVSDHHFIFWGIHMSLPLLILSWSLLCLAALQVLFLEVFQSYPGFITSWSFQWSITFTTVLPTHLTPLTSVFPLPLLQFMDAE